MYSHISILSRPPTYRIPVAVRPTVWVWGHSPVEIPVEGVDVCCECCVLLGIGLCDELITRPEEFYRMWCVVCDLETSRMRRPWPALGPSAGGGNIKPCHNLTTDKWPCFIKKFGTSCVEFWGFIDQFPGAISWFITITPQKIPDSSLQCCKQHIRPPYKNLSE
jgi:hypothetical protein